MERDPAFLAAGNAVAAERYLNQLLHSPEPQAFTGALRRFDSCFSSYCSTSPAPFLAPGLIITPEIRLQSELYLPITEISAVFTRLYHSSLTYHPLLSSTPFYQALSWADLLIALPEQFQFSANPARLLQVLLADAELLAEFLFASFLPRRFYGGFQRYPLQREYVRNWLTGAAAVSSGVHPSTCGKVRLLRCLDAACGSGEQTYGLAGLLGELGYIAEDVEVEGWTIEPLEVWAAASRRYPHDRQREMVFRQATDVLMESGYRQSIRFCCTDLLDRADWKKQSRFDLILCNGILGGPIIHEAGQLRRAVESLAALLAPGGLLLVADSFHGGWKKQVPGTLLGELFRACGLQVTAAGEGIGGQKAEA